MTDAPVARPDGSTRIIHLVAVAIALIPLVVSAVTLARHGPETALGDRALIEMHTRDVGTHEPLVGLYSRDGWSHPGPIEFFLLAPSYRLLGSDLAALMIGALVVNALAIVGMAEIARRVGGLRAALLVLLAASVVLRAFGPDLVRDPWVLPITVLPFGAFCLASWAMASGRIWALPVAAGLTTFLVQTHVQFAALAVPAFVVGGTWLVIAVRRDPRPRWRALGTTALVTAVGSVLLWLPTIWDQLFRSGNVGAIVRWFRASAEGTHTLGDGARIVFGQFAALPDWITGTRRQSRLDGGTTLQTTTLVPVLLAVVVLACVVAWRRRDRAPLRLIAMLGVNVVVGVVATARTVGVMYDYRLQWTWILAALVMAATAWIGWNALAGWRPALATAAVPVTLILLAAVAGAATIDATDTAGIEWVSNETSTAVRAAARHLDPEGGPLLLEAASIPSNWQLQGVIADLERRGFAVRVPRGADGIYGAHRAVGPGPLQAHLRVVAGPDLTGFTLPAGWKTIGYGGRRPLAEQAREGRRIQTARRRLTARFDRGEIDADTYAHRLFALALQVPSAVLILEQTGAG